MLIPCDEVNILNTFRVMIILRLLLLLTNLHLKLLSTQGTGTDILLSTQRVELFIKKFKWFRLGLSQIIDSSSQLINRFTETIHYFPLFNGIVARKCQQIDFYQTQQTRL